MFKFYRDITVFAFLFSVVTLPLSGFLTAPILFGVLGTPVGLLVFNYFQKSEFYGYYNLGYTKYYLVSRTWMINLFLCPVLYLIAYLTLKLITLGTPSGF